jgi:hypothetical protein
LPRRPAARRLQALNPPSEGIVKVLPHSSRQSVEGCWGKEITDGIERDKGDSS